MKEQSDGQIRLRKKYKKQNTKLFDFCGLPYGLYIFLYALLAWVIYYTL